MPTLKTILPSDTHVEIQSYTNSWANIGISGPSGRALYRYVTFPDSVVNDTLPIRAENLSLQEFENIIDSNRDYCRPDKPIKSARVITRRCFK